MEPYWNPVLEEQALARVHRIGQKKNVTTVRFYMKDSFEEVCFVIASKTTTLPLNLHSM